MIAFMAGHFGMPANCAGAVEDKCKSERRGFGHFRSHNSCRSAFFAGEVFLFFGLAATRRKSKQLVQGRTTAWLQTQLTRAMSGKMRNRCTRQLLAVHNAIENPFQKFVHYYFETDAIFYSSALRTA
jgi:hypothetical protein